MEHGCAPSCHTARSVHEWGLTLYVANDKCLKASLDQLKRELLYSGNIWVRLDLGGLDSRGDSTFASLGLGFVVRAAQAFMGPGFQILQHHCCEREESFPFPRTTP